MGFPECFCSLGNSDGPHQKELVAFKRFLIYLFLERGEGREKESERNINVWLPLIPPTEDLTYNQACALTGN